MHSPIDHKKFEHAEPIAPAVGAPATRRKRVTWLIIALAAVGLSVPIYRLGAGLVAKPQRTATQADSAAFTRKGNQFSIPEGSALRNLLTIRPVSEKEIVRDLIIPAAVEADPARMMKILPPLAGRITALKVRLGERVERGQALAELDSPDLRSAYADFDRAKALLDLALKTRDRLRTLGTTGGIAAKETQQAEADYITAEAEHQRAEARLHQIGVDPHAANKSRTVMITAPMAGSILDLQVAPGTYWNDATEPLLTIADLSSIFVTASVPEKDMSRIAEGQRVEVVLPAYPGEVFKGTVFFISDRVDTETRRTKVRIAFENANIRLKPGMFATVTFFAPKQLAPVLPTTALVLRDEATQVYVEIAPWTFEARSVDLAFQQGDNAVVQTGVKAGDRVITKGGVLLND